MAVVGLDIGDDSMYISVARVGGVDTVANEYSQRNTPSIVALGGKQRFMGVSAENQRNLNVRNTVSYSKNFLGKSFKDSSIQKSINKVGATVAELKDGKIGFQVQDKTYIPEQVYAMMLTKAKEIVQSHQGEHISNVVISVPSYFSQTQRHAVLDAAKISGLDNVRLMTDTSALALAYGKTKSDLPADTEEPRYVVFVDAGCAGVQSCLAAITQHKAVILASSCSTATGGKFLDESLLSHVVTDIEKKHKCEIKNNPKAMNKLRLAVEKIKKQMSANSNKLPMQIENLVDDIDIHMSLDRALFEELIQSDLEELKKTFSNLMDSTTIKTDQLHSVEIVGGTSRIPAVRSIIEEVFGVQPSSSLNADEAVSRGCGLQAAALSDKFRTKPFNIEDIVTDAIELVYTHNGQQEKILLFDEGEKSSEARDITIKADLPLHLAVQYGENVNIENKFITLYQVGAEQAKDVEIVALFNMSDDGLIKMSKVSMLNRDEAKRRKTSVPPTQQAESSESENDARNTPTLELTFTETSLGGLPSELVTHLINEERSMIDADSREITRQEAKNTLEEHLYKLRADVNESSEGLEEEDNSKSIKALFDNIENWLYEEGEDAATDVYKETLVSLKEKVQNYLLWKTRYLRAKQEEEERRKYLEQQEKYLEQQEMQRRPHSAGHQNIHRNSRQIPVVYEGVGPYTHTKPRQPSQHNSPNRHGYHDELGAGGFYHPQHQRQTDFRRQMMEDPFFSRPSFSGGPMFGYDYGW